MLVQEGPVHDASWAPDGKIFAVVAGFIPSRTLVFDAACRQIANLGDGAYNLLRWSPHVSYHKALFRSHSPDRS